MTIAPPSILEAAPRPVASVCDLAKPSRVVQLGDGRAQLLIDGQPAGIYASAEAAAAGDDLFRRMGVLS